MIANIPAIARLIALGDAPIIQQGHGIHGVVDGVSIHVLGVVQAFATLPFIRIWGRIEDPSYMTSGVKDKNIFPVDVPLWSIHPLGWQNERPRHPVL